MADHDVLPVYILSGGKSSRFGSDKARAMVGDVPLIVRVAGAMGDGAVQVVADRAGKYADLGFETIADKEAELGPVGGVLAALEDYSARAGGGGWIWVAGCDAVVLDGAVLMRMLAARGENVDVIAVRGERWEPMPGLYHTRMLPLVRAFVARGERAMWRLIEASRHRVVEVRGRWLAQINTEAELRDYVAESSARSRAN